jgi:hypothetical protein
MDCDVVYCLELEWQAGDERQEGATSLVEGLPSFSDTLTLSAMLFSNCFTFRFTSLLIHVKVSATINAPG